MPSLRAALLAMAASAVACAPSTFEGLMGGKEEQPAPATPPPTNDKEPHNAGAAPVVDPTLAAPRPVSPLSVTWVNTSTPKFRWALADGLAGAIVEVSRTRAPFKVAHRWVGTGSELVIPEALEPGMWFWRLKGRTIGTEGSDLMSPVWQVLVRGPGANKVASDAPMGSILDINGDGIPDLAMSDEEKGELATDPSYPFGITFLGHADGTFTADDNGSVYFVAGSANIGLSGGIDIDGDGYSELVTSELYQLYENDPNTKLGGVFVTHGGEKGYDDDKDNQQGWVPTPSTVTLPSIQVAGDVNGDGFGDIAVQHPDLGFVALGSGKGSGALMVFADDEDPKLPGLALASTIDFDQDGLSDIVMASSIASSPLRFTRGARDRFPSLSSLTLSTPKIPARATSITSGDFDGDGVIDIAFATVIDTAPAVCVYTPNKGALTTDNCWMGTGTADNVPTSIVSGDLEGDGTDDLVIASKSGVTVLKRDAASAKLIGTPITGSFGGRVTMIHPGRGDGIWKEARWAVLGADGLSFHVFHNTTLLQQLQIAGHKFVLKLGPTLR